MNPAIYIAIFLPLWLLIIAQQRQKRRVVAALIKKRREKKENRTMQAPAHSPVRNRMPRTPFLPANCPTKGLDRAPDTLIRLKISEKLPRLICRLSQTGSRKKLMVEEVSAMAMITRKAAAAGR